MSFLIVLGINSCYPGAQVGHSAWTVIEVHCPFIKKSAETSQALGLPKAHVASNYPRPLYEDKLQKIP